MTLLVFLVGVAAGGGGALWWGNEPVPPRAFRADEHAVELVLFKSGSGNMAQRGLGGEAVPLRIDGALLLSGLVTSTVSTISTPGDSLFVRVEALPVTVSPSDRFQSVSLEIMVRDCKAASRWRPVNRPFSITWRDAYGRTHRDRAGDFDRPMTDLLTSYIAAACGRRL
jgi:hypothetical protein